MQDPGSLLTFQGFALGAHLGPIWNPFYLRSIWTHLRSFFIYLGPICGTFHLGYFGPWDPFGGGELVYFSTFTSVLAHSHVKDLVPRNMLATQ